MLFWNRADSALPTARRGQMMMQTIVIYQQKKNDNEIARKMREPAST